MIIELGTGWYYAGGLGLGLGIGRCYVVGAEYYDVNGLGTMWNGDIMLND